MARFAFEAVDRAGSIVRGQLDAQSRSTAVEDLLSAGHTPLSLVPAREGPRSLVGFVDALRQRGGELLTIVRELSSLLKAGLTVERSLAIIRDLASNRRTSLRVGQMLERVRAGEPLSRAMRVLLPSGASHVEHLIAAGEASGQLSSVMSRLVLNMQRGKTLRDRVISALTYPAFLVVTLGAVLWIVFTSVMPRLAPLFSQAHAALPLPTLLLLRVSEFLRSYGWPVLATFLVALGGIAYALKRPKVRKALDRYLLTSRVFLGIPLKYEAARFCRNLETLLGGGMALDRALSAARSAAFNGWFRERLIEIQSAVEGGASLKLAFQNSRALPQLVVEFAAVGEETGSLAVMMGEGAEVLERDVEVRLDRLTALLLPIATLFMGLLVAGIMASIVIGLLAVNDLAR